MTGAVNWPPGTNGSSGGTKSTTAGRTSAPSVVQTVPNVTGAHKTTLDDLARAGLNPTAAFGAALGLKKVVGNNTVNQYLTKTAGKQLALPPGQSAANQAASSVQQTAKSMSDHFSKNAARIAVKDAGRFAAKRGALMGLRIAAMGVPGLTAGLLAVSWFLDSDFRKGVNNLVSTLFGPGGAPDLDAPPEPPRTHFLPLTHDGNRDKTIEKMDQGMVDTNNRAFRYRPDDVWPTASPNVPTTSSFAEFTSKLNQLNGQFKSSAQTISGLYSAYTEEPFVQRLWDKTRPGVEAMGDLGSKVVPTVGSHMAAAAQGTNAFYQSFRMINLKNRREINNSTSGMVPLVRANHINANNMSDSTSEMNGAIDELNKTTTALAGAADSFTVTPNHGAAPTNSGGTDGQVVAVPDKPADTDKDREIQQLRDKLADKPKANDLASQIGRAIPQMNPFGGGFPGAGGFPGGIPPQIPNAANAVKPLAEQLKPADKDKDKELQELRDKLADKLKAKDPGAEPVKPVDGTPVAGGSHPKDAGLKQKVPAGPGDPKASNTVEIGGHKWTADNPKLAAAAGILAGPEHKGLRQSLIDAGFTNLPPVGQDIGKQVPEAELKPFNVIMGPDNRGGFFLGELGGQPMCVDEQGQLVPLDKLLTGSGPHVGIFDIQDNGAPATDAGQVHPAANQGAPAGGTSTPAAGQGPLTVKDTDPGLLQGDSRGRTGLNPGNTPTGN